MNKIIFNFIGFLSLNGCVSTEPDWYPPERIGTPTLLSYGSSRYCEGKSPETLKFDRCMDRQDIRRIYRQCNYGILHNEYYYYNCAWFDDRHRTIFKDDDALMSNE